MSQENKGLCPVCGSVATGEAKLSPYRCDSCGFTNAYVRRFAGKRSFELWQQQIKSAGVKRFQKMQRSCEEKNTFYLCENGIAYISPEDGTCELTTAEEDVRAFKDKVLQYSASENHMVYLLQDGTVKAEGDNEYHQCDVVQFEDICFVLAAPKCTYGVTKAGQVVVCGSAVGPNVRRWTGIQKLASGSYHIAGLTKQGMVMVEGTSESISRRISQWKNVVDIVAAADGTAALCNDGTVRFESCRETENDVRKECESWKDIAAIAMDNTYVVGLTKEGAVKLAGKCRKDFWDMGRKNAAEWIDVVAVSCSRSGIGALCQDGTVKLAGNISGIAEVQAQWQKRVSDVQTQLQKAAVL